MHSPGGKVNDVLGWCELELQDAPGAINLCIIEECVTSGDLVSMHTKKESATQQHGTSIVLHRSSALARASGSKRLDNLESYQGRFKVVQDEILLGLHTWNQNSLS